MISQNAPGPCIRCKLPFIPGEMWAWGLAVANSRWIKKPVHVGPCPHGKFRLARMRDRETP